MLKLTTKINFKCFEARLHIFLCYAIAFKGYPWIVLLLVKNIIFKEFKVFGRNFSPEILFLKPSS